jgi:hypothetical protein
MPVEIVRERGAVCNGDVIRHSGQLHNSGVEC